MLQLDSDLTINKAMEKITQAERIKEQNKELREKAENVNRKREYKKKKSYDSQNWRERGNKHKQGEAQTNNTNKCTRCGNSPGHLRIKCPANKIRCRKCKIAGHFAAYCRTKNLSEIKDESGTTSSDDTPDLGENVGEIINIHNVRSKTCVPWKIKLKVGDQYIKFKIDTGTDETVICMADFEKKLKGKYKLKITGTNLIGPGSGQNTKLSTRRNKNTGNME